MTHHNEYQEPFNTIQQVPCLWRFKRLFWEVLKLKIVSHLIFIFILLYMRNCCCHLIMHLLATGQCFGKFIHTTYKFLLKKAVDTILNKLSTGAIYESQTRAYALATRHSTIKLILHIVGFLLLAPTRPQTKAYKMHGAGDRS